MIALRPTRKYIEGLISFHRAGLEFYRTVGDKPMEKWSEDQVNEWREKLRAIEAREPGQGE